MYAYLCEHMSIYKYMCRCTHPYIYMYISTNFYIYPYVHTTSTYHHIFTCTDMYVHTRTHTHTFTSVSASTYSCTHTYIHKPTHAHMHTCVPTYLETYIHAHTHTYADGHAHRHTCVYEYVYSLFHWLVCVANLAQAFRALDLIPLAGGVCDGHVQLQRARGHKRCHRECGRRPGHTAHVSRQICPGPKRPLLGRSSYPLRSKAARAIALESFLGSRMLLRSTGAHIMPAILHAILHLPCFGQSLKKRTPI